MLISRTGSLIRVGVVWLPQVCSVRRFLDTGNNGVMFGSPVVLWLGASNGTALNYLFCCWDFHSERMRLLLQDRRFRSVTQTSLCSDVPKGIKLQCCQLALCLGCCPYRFPLNSPPEEGLVLWKVRNDCIPRVLHKHVPNENRVGDLPHKRCQKTHCVKTLLTNQPPSVTKRAKREESRTAPRAEVATGWIRGGSNQSWAYVVEVLSLNIVGVTCANKVLSTHSGRLVTTR